MAQQSLLLELMTALGRVKAIEAYIKKDEADARYYGLQQPGIIWVNPVTPIVEATIHELLHEVRPQWPESVVVAHTTRLLHRMTDADIQAVYRLFQEVKVVQARTVDPDD